MSAGVTKIQEIFYELRVQEVMTSPVITVTPQTSMKELEDLLRIHRISGAPVIEDGKLVGIVSIQDLINALGASQIEQPVSAWMTRKEVLRLLNLRKTVVLCGARATHQK